jgi:hypothetical protein
MIGVTYMKYLLFAAHAGHQQYMLIGLSNNTYQHAHNVMKVFYKGDCGLVMFKGGLNEYFDVEGFISLTDNTAQRPPEHLPRDIESAFNEGAACLVIRCNNAAATMFRLCVDLTTRPLLPAQEDSTTHQPNSKQRRDLGLRLAWLFDNGKLPSDLRELAKCIREDANDAAHVGNLTKEDAEDMLDFTTALLERLITEPKKLELAGRAGKIAGRVQPNAVNAGRRPSVNDPVTKSWERWFL